MAKIIAVVRDRSNGDPVSGETVTFRNPAGSSLGTDTTGADGSAEYEANGNPAGLITWDATVSGEQREAGARAQRQIGPLFEAELAKSFKGIVSDGYADGDGDGCAVVPGAGRQVTVGTGCLWVQGIPFHFYSDTNLATTANATLATRRDAVILRVELDDSATDYGMGTLMVVEGTVNNTLPTLNSDTAGTYDYLLADVSSANGFSGYTGGNISDQREAAGPRSVGSVIAALLALKANLASPTFTGTLVAAAAQVTGALELDGALNHDGTTIGFFGTAPQTQAAALSAVSSNVADDTYSATEKAMLNNHTQSLNLIYAVLERYGLVAS